MTERMHQYLAVREAVGLLDRVECDLLAITGSERVSWLQGMVSNDVSQLTHGTARVQTFLLNATGHILSDLAVISVEDAEFCRMVGLHTNACLLLDVPPGQATAVRTTLDRFLITEDAELHDLSEKACCLSLQGPHAETLWTREVAGKIWPVVAVPADHTGSGGLDLFLPAALEESTEATLQNLGAVPVDSGIAEVLRVEAGIPRYGVDLDENVLAPEAGVNASHISLTKGCYVGQEIVARIDARGHTNRALTGLIITEGPLPQPGDRIFTRETPQEMIPREVGRITSVVEAAPAVGERPIALGYVRHEARAPGTLLEVSDQIVEIVFLQVAELPFYRKPHA